VILAPSILAADFARLAEQLAAAERGGAGLVHVDVMDGHFVPNITVGPAVVAAVRRATSLPLDVHLMVQSPDRLLDAFADAGADWISVHVEATPHLQRCVAALRARGISPGVALNPSTPIGTLDEILPEIDYVLVMTVNPGFGGQAFLPSSLGKLRRLRTAIGRLGRQVRIEVDGGVEAGNVRQLLEAGAEILVAGTSVFGGGDPEAGARALIDAGTV
jgi:ribulose-phosphate 3-epimerase